MDSFVSVARCSLASDWCFVVRAGGRGADPPAGSTLPSETPARLQPVIDSFDYERRDVMIPMRDGVKLHTVIILPKGAKGAPILLTRTPYDATAQTSHAPSTHLAPILQGYDNATEVIVEGGYIRVCRTFAENTARKAIT